jgi:hypothetical protein
MTDARKDSNNVYTLTFRLNSPPPINVYCIFDNISQKNDSHNSFMHHKNITNTLNKKDGMRDKGREQERGRETSEMFLLETLCGRRCSFSLLLFKL